MSHLSQITEHMDIIGADGVHLGTVDKVEGDRIKLTKADSGATHGDHHHFIPGALVGGISDNQVRLTANADVAAGLFEQEESGEPIG